MHRPPLASWRSTTLRVLAWALAAGALLAGTGCSTLRLAYGQAPNLAQWWADRYVDFTPAQDTQVRRAIDQWFDWQRAQQLPRIVRTLAQARAQAQLNPGATLICSWVDVAQAWRDEAFEKGVPEMARLALSLGPTQIEHIEQRQQKVNDDFRDDFLQPDPGTRHRAAVDRTLERVELLYGPLDARQQAALSEWVRQSPFDPQRWLAERQRRQQDLLGTLRQIQKNADPARAESLLWAWWQRVVSSPDEAYRRYNDALIDYNCQFAAQFHLLMSPRQRDHAADRLQVWQDDLTRFIPGRN